MSRIDLHIKYKQETGRSIEDKEIGLVRSRRQWLLDPDETGDLADDYVLENFGHTARIWFPDPDYVRWLEEKLLETLK